MVIGVRANSRSIKTLCQIFLLDEDRRIRIARFIKIKERINGGFNWFEGDCIAQNNDSPPIWPDLIREIIQPNELAKEFKNIRIIPPENFPVVFLPIKYDVNKRKKVEKIGNIWKYKIEELRVVIFEIKAIRMS